MSFSSIIKVHRFRTDRVLVGHPGAIISDNGAVSGEDAGDGCPDEVTLTAEDGASNNAALTLRPAVVERARREAEAIIEAAKREAESIRRQAWEEGFAEGREQGVRSAEMAALEHIQRIATVANNAVADATAIMRSLEEDLVDLALSIAEKVVHRRLAEDRGLIVSMVQGALECVDIVDVVRIRVNPEDLETLRAHWEKGHVDVLGRHIELTADSRVQIGGCIIDTKDSVVDAQVETRIAEIERAFRAELELAQQDRGGTT